MNIAITNAFLPSEQSSGVPYQAHHLANALCKLGHDVTVFSFSPEPSDALYRMHQFRRPAVHPRFFPFAMAYRLARADFSAFDVVNCHGDNYLLRSPRPVVRTFHGTALDEMQHAHTLRRRLFFLMTIPLEHIGARLADHVVGVSEATRAHMPAVQSVIPCGADREKRTPDGVVRRNRGRPQARRLARGSLPKRGIARHSGCGTANGFRGERR